MPASQALMVFLEGLPLSPAKGLRFERTSNLVNAFFPVSAAAIPLSMSRHAVKNENRIILFFPLMMALTLNTAFLIQIHHPVMLRHRIRYPDLTVYDKHVVVSIRVLRAPLLSRHRYPVSS